MNVLIMAPHADDEILGAGGTISKFIHDGHDVYVCIVTCGHPSMYSKDILEKLRFEVKGAHRYLGVKETLFLELPAVLLSEIPKYEINKKINDVINMIKPKVVFIPHFGDIHMDHFIVAQSTMVAVRPIRENTVIEVYSYETLSETEWNTPHLSNSFVPNTFVDISDYLNKKVEAMNYFNTQLIEFPHPRSIQAIESLARVRGSTIGVNAAEAFCLIRRIIL